MALSFLKLQKISFMNSIMLSQNGCIAYDGGAEKG